MLYVQAEVVDRDSFSDRAVDSLDDREVRDVVAREVAAPAAGRHGPGLGRHRRRRSRRPWTAPSARPASSAPSRRAAAETHDALFSRGEDSVFFDVPNVGRAIAPDARAVAPGLADSIPRAGGDAPARDRAAAPRGAGAALADDLGPLGIGLLAIGVGLLAAGWMAGARPPRRAHPDRAGAGRRLGAAPGQRCSSPRRSWRRTPRAATRWREDDVSPAVEGVWNAYAGDLVTSALVFAVLALARPGCRRGPRAARAGRAARALVSRRWSPTRLRCGCSAASSRSSGPPRRLPPDAQLAAPGLQPVDQPRPGAGPRRGRDPRRRSIGSGSGAGRGSRAGRADAR